MASKMKENFKKNMHRITQVASQTVGRAEKTQVLNVVHENLETKIDRMTGALKHTRNSLADCLRTRSKEDNIDKRRRKVMEFDLVQSLTTDSQELLDNPPEAKLLGSVLSLYGQASNAVLDELVQTELDIEKRVVDRLGKFAEDEKNINHMREKLRKAVLDMDSAKTRLQARQQSVEKVAEAKIQEELEAAENKVESCKDSLVTDLYVLAGKEVDMANIFAVLVEIQMEYHRTAAKTLENLLPQITKKIAMYDRRPVFGSPLPDHLRYSNREIALVLEVCCCALIDLGLNEEGLFRISGNATKVRKLKAGFDAGEIDLTDYDKDPHSIAGALKSYLRELPEPLMTHNLYKDWMQAGNVEGQQRIDLVRDCLSMMPKANLVNLRYLVKFLAKMLEHEKDTKMNASNLAIVMGPNVIWSGNDGDNFLGSRLMECLITNADYFFPAEIHYTSNLIGSLYDRDGGFDRLDMTNLPITNAAAAAAPGDPARRSPPQKQTTPPPPGGANRSVDSSPTPISGQNGGQKNRAGPTMQKRPKEKAPPPPAVSKTTTTQLAATKQRNSSSPDTLLTGVTELPGFSGPPSKSSSMNDSLNDYGSEDEQEHELYASVPPEDPEMDPPAKLRSSPSPDKNPPVKTPKEGGAVNRMIASLHANSSVTSDSRAGSSNSYASVGSLNESKELPGVRGHRKTNSLDRPLAKPSRIIGPPSGGPQSEQHSLDRATVKKPVLGRFPNDSDLDRMMLGPPPVPAQRNSVVLVEETSVGQGSEGTSRWTPVVQQHPHPNRPPPPKKENLEKNSVFRSSLRRTTEEEEEKLTEDSSSITRIYPDLTNHGSVRSVVRPNSAPQAAPRVRPGANGNPASGNFVAQHVSSGEVTNIVVNGNVGGPNSPESPKTKPPLPAKPKQMETESWNNP